MANGNSDKQESPRVAPAVTPVETEVKAGLQVSAGKSQTQEAHVRLRAGMHAVVKRADGTEEDLGWQYEEVEIPESQAIELLGEEAVRGLRERSE